MKWRGSFLFFLLSFYFITAARGQLISISVKNESLEKVFVLIEQQSDHHFIYTSEQLAKARPVTLSVTNEKLIQVLDKCFAGQPLDYRIVERNITVKEKPVVILSRELHGKVVTENGEPVAGITVAVKNTALISSSDGNGEFGFPAAPLRVTLLVSGAEMESQEDVVGEAPFAFITVNKKVGVLDETFVIAYGKSTRRMATGSVTSIKKEEIEKQPISNPLSALTGRVSGLQVTQISGTPGSEFTIRLRGQNSMANGNDPLVIVDGVPFPYSSLHTIFGGGIAASPLAILNPSDIESIEVLKDADATAIYGSRGANGVILISTRKAQTGMTTVSIRHYSGAGRVTRTLNLLKTSDYLQMRREAFANDDNTPTPTGAPDLLVWDSTRYTDWQRELLDNTMQITDTKLELAGGTASTKFLFGAGYHRETTTLPSSAFSERKYSFNLNLQHKTTNQKWNFGFSTAYAGNRTNLPQSDLSNLIILPPNAPALYKENGDLNWENSTWSNPLSVLRKRYWSQSENFLNNLTVSFAIVKGLEAKASLGYSMTRIRERSATPLSSYDPALNSISSAGFGNSGISTLVTEPQLLYSRSGPLWNFKAIAGITLQSSNQHSLYQSGSGYASDDLLGSLKAAAQISSASENDIAYRYTGIFGRLTADWKQKYLLSLTGRRDGSSRYGPANRFATFGSVGLGWVFSSEPWLTKSSFLSFGKLRISAGTTGNDQIGDYNYLDLYSPLSFTYQGVVPFQPVQLYSPAYSWELVRKWEAVLDLGFWENRLTTILRYYHNQTDNQLVQYALPPSTGFNGILKNLPARILNNGWELELIGTPVQSKDWKWMVSGNLTIPYNKLLRFDNLSSSSYANTYVISQPLTIAKRYAYLGIDSVGNYRFQDANRDGHISAPNDQQTVVNTGLQYFGGLENTLTWKKLSLSFLLQFVGQKYAPTYTAKFGKPGTLSNQPIDVLDRWQESKTFSTVQKFSVSNSANNTAFNNFRLSDGAYSNASFLRLRTLYLSYDCMNVHTRKAGLTNLQVYLQGQNLFTITNYRSIDPETKSFMPPVRMLTAGLQIGF